MNFIKKVKNYIGINDCFKTKKISFLFIFSFVSLYIYYTNKIIEPMFIYTSIENGGLGKFGFDTMSETANFRAKFIAIASFINIFISAPTIFMKSDFLIFIGLIFRLFQTIIYFSAHTHVLSYILFHLANSISTILIHIGFMRYLSIIGDEYYEKNNVKIKGELFVMYYIIINISSLIARILTGYLRVFFSFKNIFGFLILINLLLIYVTKFLKLENKLIEDKEIEENIIFFKNAFQSIYNIFVKNYKIIFIFIFLLLFIIINIKFIFYFNIYNNYFYIFIVLFLLFLLNKYKEYILNKNIIKTVLFIITITSVYKTFSVFSLFEEFPLIVWLNYYTNRNVFGFEIPAESITAIAPVLSIIFSYKINKFVSWFKNLKIFGKEEMNFIDLLISLFFCVLSAFCILITNLEFQKYEKNGLFFPLLFFIFFSFGEMIYYPKQNHYILTFIKSSLCSLIYLISKLSNSICYNLIAKIPHQSFENKNLISVFYLGLCFCIISIILIFIFKIFIYFFDKNND